MKKLTNITLLLFAVFAIYSCSEEETETPQENPQALNIVETGQTHTLDSGICINK